MNEQQLENLNEAPINQVNIKQIIKNYKLTFPCPHCEKEINDEHFSKEHRAFNYISEQIRELVEKYFLSQENEYRKKWLKELEANRTYENLPAVKEIKKNLEFQTKKIAELQSSEYIEKLERVRKLNEENNELRNQIQLLMIKSRAVKRKGEDFEHYVSGELNRVFFGKDKIEKINQTQTGKKADFIQEVLTETEPKKIAGKIIYEAKDTEKWSDEWIHKLDKDMINFKADFGIIIAACENGEPLRCVDPRKKIYVSDDANFTYIAKIMRDTIIQRYNLLETVNNDRDSKEKRIRSLDEWVGNKLPQYLSRLEKKLADLNNNTDKISRAAQNLKDLETDIRKIILEEIRTELSNL
ncbi:DUF2130 domain-containing protein [endosymbiont GvMRE of Glomus versiforme]|uniref:DUF2130 domain-containing protein n=1 Tax=endosymbiont GvMRE of Glomus versiforme TaxID=2039283 RepID=UPI000EBE25BE|nr:DUF2130 domain-containing protein [endosymbiont GvMRE of Glomus versiforme]RHZ36607.1 Chromosome segregation ATPase [endosymbiont GvMRE of Glomus versiforme]